MANLKSQFSSHETQDEQRFERMFGYMKDQFDKIDTKSDKANDKLDALWDIKNKQDGAFGFGKIVAGGIGGLFVAAIDVLLK